MSLNKFILRTGLFIAIVFLLDFALSMVLSHYAIEWQYDKRMERILTQQEKSKIIIMGSSRSFNTIVGGVMQKETKASTYSYGYPGTNIDFHETLLNLLLKNEALPKLMVLILDEHQEFFEDPFLSYRMDYLYPWSKYQDIRNIVNEREKYQYYSVSRSYIYKKCDFGKLYRSKGAPYFPLIGENGPLPRSDKSLTIDTLQYRPYKTYHIENENKNLRNKFLSFINLCETNNIGLLLVSPPNFYPTDSTFNNRIQSLIKCRKKVWLYFNPDKKYLDKKWFFDRFHLNASGAEMYTQELSEYISKRKLLHQ